MKEGTTVRYSRAHLRSTGQYTGPEAPCSHGPFAKGEVIGFRKGFPQHVEVLWADGATFLVHRGALETARPFGSR